MRTNLHYLKFMTCTLLILSFISISDLQAQDYLISFTGSGNSTTVATIKVENLTKGTSLTMNGSDVLHLMGVVTGIETVKDNEAGKIGFYPNPMKDYSRMQFFLPEPGKTLITLYDLSGRKIVQIQDLLPNGQHTYGIQGVEEGIYFVKISSGRYSFSGRFISSVSQNRNQKIVYENTENTMVKPEKQSDSKGTNAETVMQYTTGDRLKLTGISGNYSTVITDVPGSSKTITFGFIACTDADNNNYPIVKIGNQTWMAENLKTTKLIGGSPVSLVTDSLAWIALTNSGYCWYRNKEAANKNTYGALYNWFAVTAGNLCPTGWHIPIDTEWSTLMTFVGYSSNKLRETGTIHWRGTNLNATNETGFTALPGGYRGSVNSNGSFLDLGYCADWWSATQSTATYGYDYYLEALYPTVTQESDSKNVGFSVRCVKD
jgi:uncharacterized protein (TIGR02145 family)